MFSNGLLSMPVCVCMRVCDVRVCPRHVVRVYLTLQAQNIALLCFPIRLSYDKNSRFLIRTTHKHTYSDCLDSISFRSLQLPDSNLFRPFLFWCLEREKQNKSSHEKSEAEYLTKLTKIMSLFFSLAK